VPTAVLQVREENMDAADREERALECLERVILAAPADLDDVCIDLMASLVHLENSYNLAVTITHSSNASASP
jgi:hypothetical protein